MTPDIVMILLILAASVVLLVTEWIPMEVTAMLALAVVALVGLVKPVEALSGFSNPAVVTVWAVFIISGGLTRTGVASALGSIVLRMVGRSESRMIVVIMTTAGVLSAIMNNVAVAALMLPVVMDIARHTETPPSKLLMPLAYGSLLGGLTTQIGTPPNILVTDALRDGGLRPFTFFDFTPVGLVVMASGILFMVVVGRHLLPVRDVARESARGRPADWKSQYALQEGMFSVRIPAASMLVGKTLAESRMGSVLGWNVIGITRGDRTLLAPGPADDLQAGDLLTVEGGAEGLDELKNWRELVVEAGDIHIEEAFGAGILLGEVRLPGNSPYVGKTLNAIGFRARFGVDVLAVRRGDLVRRAKLQDEMLARGDILLVSGSREQLSAFEAAPGWEGFRHVPPAELTERYQLHERLMVMQVPEDASLVGRSLKESRLADAVGSRVLGIVRGSDPMFPPEPEEVLRAGDRLLVEGRRADFQILEGLEHLEVERRPPPDVETLVSGSTGLVEAILSPHATLEGKSLRQLNFREKYGLSVLAIWRGGQSYRFNLRDMALRFGDALLLLGPRSKLELLGREADFIVLTETAQETLRREKMSTALIILAGVLAPVIAGWVPIYIAVVVGAALMVLFGCLTMEEAYRQIEWKAVFLIAGMLPLGTALDQTGAARLIAEGVVALVGPLGSQAVMAGLVMLTFASTCFVPTAALVVLMAPIVLNTAQDVGASPYALMMAIAMAASASFMTPISHPANILVMGPGGYRFMDYFKIGGLLTLVIMVVLIWVLPFFWPLAG